MIDKNKKYYIGKIEWFGGYNKSQKRENDFGYIKYIDTLSNQIHNVWVHKNELTGDHSLYYENVWVSFLIIQNQANKKNKAISVNLFSFENIRKDAFDDFIKNYKELLLEKDYYDLAKYEIAYGEDIDLKYLKNHKINLLLEFIDLKDIIQYRPSLDFILSLIESKKSLDHQNINFNTKDSSNKILIDYFISSDCHPEIFQKCIHFFETNIFIFIIDKKNDVFNEKMVKYVLENHLIDKPYLFLLKRGFFDVLCEMFTTEFLINHSDFNNFFYECLMENKSLNMNSQFSLHDPISFEYFKKEMFSYDLKINHIDQYVCNSTINKNEAEIDNLKINILKEDVFIEYLQKNKIKKLLKYFDFSEIIKHEASLNFILHLIENQKSLDDIYSDFQLKKSSSSLNEILFKYFISSECSKQVFEKAVQYLGHILLNDEIVQKNDILINKVINFICNDSQINMYDFLFRAGFFNHLNQNKLDLKSLKDIFSVCRSSDIWDFTLDDFRLISMWISSKNMLFFENKIFELENKNQTLILEKNQTSIYSITNIFFDKKDTLLPQDIVKMISARSSEKFMLKLLNKFYPNSLIRDRSLEQIEQNYDHKDWTQYDISIEKNNQIIKKFDVKTTRINNGSFSEFIIKNKNQAQKKIDFIGCMIDFSIPSNFLFDIKSKKLFFDENKQPKITYIGNTVLDFNQLLECANLFLKQNDTENKLTFTISKNKIEQIQLWMFDQGFLIQKYVNDYQNKLNDYTKKYEIDILNVRKQIFNELTDENLDSYIFDLYSYQNQTSFNQIVLPSKSKIDLLHFFKILTYFMENLKICINKPLIYMSILIDFLYHCTQNDINYQPKQYLKLFTVIDHEDKQYPQENFIIGQKDFLGFFKNMIDVLNKSYEYIVENLKNKRYRKFYFSSIGVLRAEIEHQKKITIFSHCGGKSIFHVNDNCGNVNLNIVDDIVCNDCHYLICKKCGTCKIYLEPCPNIEIRKLCIQNKNHLKLIEDLAKNLLKHAQYNTSIELPHLIYLIRGLYSSDIVCISDIKNHTKADDNDIEEWTRNARELTNFLKDDQYIKIFDFLEIEPQLYEFKKIKIFRQNDKTISLSKHFF